MIPRAAEPSSVCGRPALDEGPGRGGRRGEISRYRASGDTSNFIASRLSAVDVSVEATN